MDRQCTGSEVSGNPLLPLLGAGFVQGLCRRAARTVPPHLREECEAEAWVVLWQAHDKLQALPEAERRAYATVCVRHRLGQVCRRERQRRALLVAWDALPLSAAWTGESRQRPMPAWEPHGSGCLLDQIDRADLAAAVRVLPPRDQRLLDLYYAQQFTDGEIARRWNSSPGAVKMQRHRTIVKLRQVLQQEGSS